MAASMALDIEQLLECPICLGEFEDPRVLPCIHSLCLKCLTEYVTKDAVNNQFKCPTCRHRCHLPAGGAAAFPKNFMLNSLKAIKPRSRERVCSNNNKGGAPHTPPTVFCVECAEFYCSNCEASHRMFGISSGHRLRPAGEIGLMDVPAPESEPKSLKCDKHPGQLVGIYCGTCQIPICASCCHLSHRKHNHRDLNEVAREAKVGFDYSKVKADKIEKRFDEDLQRLDLSEKQINKDGNEVCQQIKREADELRAAITKQEQSLTKKVQTSQSAAVTDVRVAYNQAQLNKVAARSLKSYIQALQTSGGAIDHVTHFPGIQEQLRQLDSAPQLLVSWNVGIKKESQGVAALGAMLGTVCIDKTVLPSGVVGGKSKAALCDPVKCLKPNLRLGLPLSGLAVIGDFVFATGWWQPYLWVHNMMTNTHKQLTVKSMKPAGMTAVHNINDNNNTVVITDVNKALHFVTISPQNMNITKHTVKSIPFEPRNVNVDTKTGKLIIANQTDKQIVVCDNTGNIEDRVTVKTRFGSMRCALATDDGYVILDHSDPGRVHWVTKRGDVIHTYGERDNEGLCKPEGMAMGRQGLLVPTDCLNNKVHLIDVNRQLSHYILTKKDDFKFPVCICLDETTGRLFITHVDRHDATTVSVYNWPYGNCP